MSSLSGIPEVFLPSSPEDATGAGGFSRPPRWEPLTHVDLPGVFLDNLIRGRLFKAGFNPEKMTPNDRLEVADRVKAMTGNHPVTGALVEVAMNPWVWLSVALSIPFKLPPVGETFSKHPVYSATVRRFGPFLQKLGLLTAQQELSGSEALAALRQVKGDVDGFLGRTAGFQAARQEVLKANGLRNLSDDPVLSAAIQAKLHGLDRTRRDVVPVIKKPSRKEAPRIVFEEVEQVQLLNAQKLDAYIESKGASRLIEEARKSYESAWSELFLTNGEVDPEKLMRIYRGSRVDMNGAKVRGLGETTAGVLFSNRTMNMLERGQISYEQFESMVKQSLARKEFYAPLNATNSYISRNGLLQRITPSELQRLRRQQILEGRSYAPTTGAIERRKKKVSLWDDESLGLLAEFTGEDSAENFEKALRESQQAKNKYLSGGPRSRPLSMMKLDAEASYNRYMTDSSITYALHVQRPGPDVLHAQKQAIDSINEAVKKGWRVGEDGKALPIKGTYDKGITGARGLDQVAQVVGDGADPLGGYSMWDVLRASHEKITDPVTRNHLSEVITPVILRKKSLPEGLITASVNWSKGVAALMSEGSVGKSIGSSAFGQQFVKWMKDFGSSPLTDPLGADRTTARYLYGTTLGFNPASILLNVMQPLFTTTRHVELPHLFTGYKEAFKDFSTYVSKRNAYIKKHGITRRGFLVGPEHQAAKNRIVRESFRFAEEAGLGGEITDVIDQLRGPLLTASRSGIRGRVEDLTDLSLKGFEKGEILNRSVTAHAVAARARAQGIEGPRVSEAIRRTVDETQFGANPLNTPIGFLGPSNIFTNQLANPAVRQFLTFPTRMVVGLVEGTKLGGSGMQAAIAEGSITPAFTYFRDIARAMGFGAAFYEIGKELFGLELTGGTIPGAVSGLVRTSGTAAPLPLAPALNIPASVALAIAQQDMQALRYTIPTLIPGGVALSRLTGIGPRSGVLSETGMQRFSVDWSQRTEDGRYPVMSTDGRVISFETKLGIAARAAGVDMGKFRDEGQLAGYLSRIREETLRYRREWIHATLNNQTGKAAKIARDYEKKFQMPLKVSEQQVIDFRRQRETSRVERMLDGLPADLREQITPSVADAMGARLGIKPQMFMAGATSRERREGTRHSFKRPLSPEVRRALEELVADNGGEVPPSSPFTPFGVTTGNQQARR